MADNPISSLPAAGALSGTELTVLVQGGVTKQSTVVDDANKASAFLKKDGTTNGATSQAQQFVNGWSTTQTIGTVTITFRCTPGGDMTMTRIDSNDGSSVTAGVYSDGRIEAVNNVTGALVKLDSAKLTTDKIEEKSSGNAVLISGQGIKTDIGALAATGKWKLGNYKLNESGVAVNADHFIEIEIDDTIYRLAIVDLT